MNVIRTIHQLLEKQLQSRGNLQPVAVHDINRIHRDAEDEPPLISELFQ